VFSIGFAGLAPQTEGSKPAKAENRQKQGEFVHANKPAPNVKASDVDLNFGRAWPDFSHRGAPKCLRRGRKTGRGLAPGMRAQREGTEQPGGSEELPD
jgi:hypothetical protein